MLMNVLYVKLKVSSDFFKVNAIGCEGMFHWHCMNVNECLVHEMTVSFLCLDGNSKVVLERF